MLIKKAIMPSGEDGNTRIMHHEVQLSTILTPYVIGRNGANSGRPAPVGVQPQSHQFLLNGDAKPLTKPDAGEPRWMNQTQGASHC